MKTVMEKRRIRLKLSRAELSRATLIPLGLLGRVENDGTGCRGLYARRIAKRLGRQVDTLFKKVVTTRYVARKR